MSTRRHVCPKNKWIHGLGWKCNDCDPAIVAAREQSREQAERQYAVRDKLWRDEYRYCLRQARKRGMTLKDAREYARNAAQNLFD